MPKLELTEREAQTLNGILLVEEDDLKDLIQNSDDKDKKELVQVKSIKTKLNKFNILLKAFLTLFKKVE